MTKTLPFPYHTAARSHRGLVRERNEDRYAVLPLLHQRPPSLLAVVADGLGGHRAGEIAAEIAVEQVTAAVQQGDPREPLATLARALAQAHRTIRAHGENHPEHEGLGTTCAVAWIIGRRLYIASVGDSRIYLLRGEHLYRLTTDHTWLQEAVAQGIVTPEAAQGHPLGRLLHRHLGSPRHAEPDLRLRLHPEESDIQALHNQGLRLHPHDRLLLCTDGLSDLVREEEIRHTLAHLPLNAAVDALVNLALERGGRDNITVVGVEVMKGRHSTKGRGKFREVLWPTLLGLSLLLLCGVLAFGVWVLWLGGR